jgi:hypothetical protein
MIFLTKKRCYNPFGGDAVAFTKNHGAISALSKDHRNYEYKPEEENMAKRRPFGWKKGIIPAIILAGVFFAIASVNSSTDLEDKRPDIQMIDLPPMP